MNQRAIRAVYIRGGTPQVGILSRPRDGDQAHIAARVTGGANPKVEETVVYRTARRLTQGAVLAPGSRIRDIASASA
jgi:hypothetical protein